MPDKVQTSSVQNPGTQYQIPAVSRETEQSLGSFKPFQDSPTDQKRLWK